MITELLDTQKWTLNKEYIHVGTEEIKLGLNLADEVEIDWRYFLALDNTRTFLRLRPEVDFVPRTMADMDALMSKGFCIIHPRPAVLTNLLLHIGVGTNTTIQLRYAPFVLYLLLCWETSLEIPEPQHADDYRVNFMRELSNVLGVDVDLQKDSMNIAFGTFNITLYEEDNMRSVLAVLRKMWNRPELITYDESEIKTGVDFSQGTGYNGRVISSRVEDGIHTVAYNIYGGGIFRRPLADFNFKINKGAPLSQAFSKLHCKPLVAPSQKRDAIDEDIAEEKRTKPTDFIHTSVAVTCSAEYYVVLGIYFALGADRWPWHKGYKEIDQDDLDEGVTYNLYGWDPCGFLKHAGMGATSTPTFKTVNEFVREARRVLGTDQKED